MQGVTEGSARRGTRQPGIGGATHHRGSLCGVSQQQAGLGGQVGGGGRALQRQVLRQPEEAAAQLGRAQRQELRGLLAVPTQRAEHRRRLLLWAAGHGDKAGWVWPRRQQTRRPATGAAAARQGSTPPCGATPRSKRPACRRAAQALSSQNTLRLGTGGGRTCDIPSSLSVASSGRSWPCTSRHSASGVDSMTSAALEMRRRRCCCSRKACTACAWSRCTAGGGHTAWRRRWLTRDTATPWRVR